MPSPKYPKIAQLKTLEQFQARLDELGIHIPCDEELLSAEQGTPLAQPFKVRDVTVGNRWCIHPMEGWDANRDGTPTARTLRRWERFGQSGAKLIWGGEAAAVQPTGRANPNQTLATRENEGGLRELLSVLRHAHEETCGSDEGLLVGLQLTHSGRFCKPNDHKRWESRIAYHHPLLDAKFGIDPNDPLVVLSDQELEQLANDYLSAAKLAAKVGFQFVDIKACHGYLLHEFLSARSRPGPYGGDLEGRSRLLRTIIGRVREECPELIIGVRLSLFDMLPYQPSDDANSPVGIPMAWGEEDYDCGFGLDPSNPADRDLSEPIALVKLLQETGVDMLNYTAGSPYYNPHIQRPAIFPPSDGYQPPEDPLCGVARQIDAVAEMKKSFPDLATVGSAYTYLQEYLPQVSQAVVRASMVDFVGLGRMVLSHPTLPWDTLHGRPPTRKLICRTFSDCTTAPRNGIVSGCFPLDDFYKRSKEREQLKAVT